MQDPVKSCPVYKNEGCAHVDGYLCNYPDCPMIEKTLNDKILERLSKLYRDLPLEHAVYVMDAMYDIEKEMALFSVPVEHGGRSRG